MFSINFIFAVFVFALGLIVGSFLNVLIFRIGTGRGVMGRSSCSSCSKTLSPLELIPVLSFLFLRGRCKTCRSSFSVQYPIVELITGCLFLFGLLKISSTNPSFTFLITYAVLFFVYVSALIVIAFYDARHMIIPDSLSFIVGGTAFLWFLTNTQRTGELIVKDFLIGPILFLFFFAFWYLSQGRVMGLGDAKLAVGLGWFLGFWMGVSALILSFWIGAAFSLVMIGLRKLLNRNTLSIAGKPITIKSEIPFAPFLILSTLLVYFWNIDLIHAILY